jgi:hypothetical protein
MAKGSIYGNVISPDPAISFNGGLDTRLPENAASNTFSSGTNVSVTTQGLLTFRPGLKRWLPDTVDTAYQVYPAIYNYTQIYYFICDNGKIKYCQDGDTAWTTCAGTYSVTRHLRYQFIHCEDKLYMANGTDNSMYVDLTTMTVKTFTSIPNPTNAPTAAAFGSGLTYATSSGGSTPYPVYYSITFNGDIGETMNSPILTGWVSIARTDWTGANAYGLTITRNNATPAGATSWNLYVSTGSSSGSVTNDNMVLLAQGLDINSTVFNDNGTLQPQLDHGTAPNDNSTEGFAATYGTEIDGRVYLWGITGDEYSLRIGGDPGNAFDFTPNNGGYRLRMNRGTNHFPTNLISFRNSQGIPSITMLYSNSRGTSKQAVIEQSTVNYGSYSFVVWGATDQGRNVPAGSSPYGAFAYNNSLYFPTNSAVMELTTRPTTLNILSVNNVSVPIANLWQSIRADQLPNIVACGIDDKMYFSCAVNGFTYNNIILVYDVTDPNNPRWYPWNIKNQWIGLVSPPNNNVFTYVCQDNHIFKLEQGYVAQDEDSNGIPHPFVFGATGPLSGTNQDHSSYLALVQTVFYLVGVLGNITVSVTYGTASPSGAINYKTRTKTVTGTPAVISYDGSWTDYPYQFLPAEEALLAWGDNAPFSTSTIPQIPANYRPLIPVNEVVNENQWSFSSDPLNFCAATLRSVSYEGVSIGVKADVQ